MARVAGKSPANAAEAAARRAQARAEGAKSGDHVTFRGERFRLEPGPMPGAAVLIMSHFGAMDPGVRDPQAEDGIWQILEMLLAQPSGIPPGEEGYAPDGWDPGEFRRFMRFYAKTRAGIEEIAGEGGILQQAVEIVSARPTGRPPVSSNGRPATTASSTDSSSGSVEAVLSP